MRRELREYFAELMTPEVQAEVASGRDRRSGVPRGRPHRWGATAGSASAGRRSTAARAAATLEQFIFINEAWRAGAPAAVPHASTRSARRSWSSAPQEQKDVLPARGSSPASSTSRSATPSPAPAPTSRRSRTKAVKDGDEWVINGQKIFTSLAQLRRLHLAGGPHRPRRAEAQGHLDLRSCRPPTRASRYTKIHTMVNASTHVQHVLRRRARARRRDRRRRQPRLGPHHQPAQLRARVAGARRGWSSGATRTSSRGRRTRSCPTAAA